MNVPASFAVPSPSDLEAAFSRYQWDETAQIAYEILAAQPNNGAAKIKGAYALFQRGFTNAALLMLRRLNPDDWKTLPQGQDKFVEIVSLFQKKVPLNLLPGRLEQVSPERVSPFLRDEIRYAKGRESLDRKEYARAREYLTAISRSSRFYIQAQYNLAAIAVRANDFETASAEFSRIFEPSILSQTSEFWRDMSTQMTSHWGASVKVLLDTEPLLTSKRVGELALLGFARIAYAKKSYETALGYYEKFTPESRFFARANLEKIWALLALEKHEDAQKAAAALSNDESHFESIEARTIRALILVDAGRTQEGRDEISRFFSIHEKAKDGLNRYQKYGTTDSLPEFMKEYMKGEVRAQANADYRVSVQEEIKHLDEQDRRLFPVYHRLALELDPMLGQSQKEVSRITLARVALRLADLERLALQARLIMAESWLEDREKLRQEFREMKSPTEAKQKEHDERLVDLLGRAVKEVDEALSMKKGRAPALEFRQAELLWELSTARAILSQSNGNKKSDETAADELKKRALRVAEDVVATYPTFPKHADALFFTGFAQLELGRDAQGIGSLERYLQKYPHHFHVPDALRIIADAHFDRNDFHGALGYYRRILEFRDSPIIGYSLYKIGWCAYNEKNFSQALLGLERAISWATQAQSDSADVSLNLTRESKRDLISIYAEVGDYRKALSYFKTVFGDKAQTMLAELSKELDSTGQFEKSTELYKTLISLSPNAPENLGYQTAIVKGAYKLRRWEKVEKEANELVDRYRSEVKEPKPDGDSFGAEKVLRETALAQHFEFKKTATKEDSARIVRLDRSYLAAFEKWPSSQEVQYELAAYLLENGNKKDAAEAFKAHWTRYNTTLKEPLKEEALRNLLYTQEKVEQSERNGNVQRQQDTKTLSESASDIIAFSTVYSTAYPSTKSARPIAGLRAAVLFKYEQMDQGVLESQKILDEKAGDEPGKQAFKNLRLAYYKKKDWKVTYDWATKMSARPEMGPYAKDLASIRGESAFLLAEAEPDNEKAAAQFQAIAVDPQMAPLREKALYNAFIRLEKAGKKAEAIEISSKLAKQAPRFDGLQQASGLRAALYQEAGDYERALPLLRDFLRSHDKDVPAETLQQARLNAALISEATGSTEPAVGLFRAYLDNAKGSAPGADEAKRAIDRIQNRGRRSIASVPNWDGLLHEKTEFEKSPIPKGKELADRITKGGAKLEGLVKKFLAIAAKPDAPPSNQFEAYCAVPFLYQSYAEGIVRLGKGNPAEVTAELMKVAGPIEGKAKELAGECLKRGTENEHEGPSFRRATEKWGWQSDPKLRKKTDRIVALIEKSAPWMEPVSVSQSEAEILDQHLRGGGTPDTWYALARLRYLSRRSGLARLTLIDALGKAPNAGRLLNTLALIEQEQPNAKGLSSLYERAAKEGSTAALVNLGLFHLKAGRLTAATGPLREALGNKAFDGNDDLKNLVKEVAAP